MIPSLINVKINPDGQNRHVACITVDAQRFRSLMTAQILAISHTARTPRECAEWVSERVAEIERDHIGYGWPSQANDAIYIKRADRAVLCAQPEVPRDEWETQRFASAAEVDTYIERMTSQLEYTLPVGPDLPPITIRLALQDGVWRYNLGPGYGWSTGSRDYKKSVSAAFAAAHHHARGQL